MQRGCAELLKSKPVALVFLLAAAKMDDDVKKNLLPAELGNVSELSNCFGNLASSERDC